MRTLIYGIFSLLSMATSFGITAGLGRSCADPEWEHVPKHLCQHHRPNC